MASILADVDDQINAYDNSITERIEKWIKDNYKCSELKISDNPNKDGLYEVSAHHVEVKNTSITSLTNGMFEWIKAKYFSCSCCSLLTSLVGAPKEVEGHFSCSYCNLLTSLVGAPEKVGVDFNCAYCIKLESLKGAPRKIEGHFDCYGCKNLSSLKGAPLTVRDSFYCSFCNSLSSLKGVPKEIGGNFYCYMCKTQFTEDDIRKVSNIKEKVFVK